MTTFYVIEKGECDTCQGTGHEDVSRGMIPFCRMCARSYPHEELATLDDADPKMPCGHAWRYLEESVLCGDCEGTGYIRREVPLEQALAALGLTAEAMGK